MKKRIEPEFIGRVRERIKQRMELLGISQAELADRAGVSRSGITELMKRDRSPSCEFLMKVANELSVSVDYLLGLADESEIRDIIRNERIGTLVTRFLSLSIADQDRALEMLRLMGETGGNATSAKRDV
jgi:transcriptional regulator with XRE-family HTH domain